MWMQWLAVAVGGALGAMGRYGLGLLAIRLWGAGFPYGVLIANVLGSFAIGVISVLLLERGEDWVLPRLLLITGMLGAFTTFSSFSLDTIHLLSSGQWKAAAANVVLNLVLCLSATFAGIAIARF